MTLTPPGHVHFCDIHHSSTTNVKTLYTDGNAKQWNSIIWSFVLFQYGLTPLYTAAHNGHEKVITILLRSGCDIDKVSITVFSLYICSFAF